MIKFFRRRVSKAQKIGDDQFLENPAQIWESIKTLWGSTHRRCIENSPAAWKLFDSRDTIPDITLFSDASLDGWGAVLFAGGKILMDCGPWPLGTNKHINILESKALENSIIFLKRYLFENLQTRSANVSILVDNTSVLGAVKKEQSASFHLNVLAGRILDSLNMCERINRWEIHYVSSAENCADTPSRIFSATPLK